MMNKRLKQGSTFLLAVALTFPLLTLPGAKAANAIDTDAECSIQFDIGGNSSELLSASIPVNLYKVASVDVSGNYTATGAFSKLDFSSVQAGAGKLVAHHEAVGAGELAQEARLAARARAHVQHGLHARNRRGDTRSDRAKPGPASPAGLCRRGEAPCGRRARAAEMGRRPQDRHADERGCL